MQLSGNTSWNPTYPTEIIAEIIGHLHDDKDCLLSLGRVSRQTLYYSRCHLFSTLRFKHRDEHFDEFLRLVDVTWTSFTPAVQCIHLVNLFHNERHHYSIKRNIPRIIANLPNVKSLWISLFTSWRAVPPDILDFLFHLNIEDFRLGGTGRWDTESLVDLFGRLPPSLRRLSFADMEFDRVPDLSGKSSVFHRPLWFTSLDTRSVVLFKDAWDPSVSHDLDIKVQAFELQPFYHGTYERNEYAPFISRFLQHVGPSLSSLSIHLSGPHGQELKYFDSIDFSQCTNVCAVYIGEVTLSDHVPESLPTIATMWKLLSALPSPSSLQEARFTFKLDISYTSSLEEQLASSFEWSKFVSTLRRMFPRVDKIAIQVGVPTRGDNSPYIEVLRRVANLKALEDRGLVEFRAFFSPVIGRPICVRRRRRNSLGA